MMKKYWQYAVVSMAVVIYWVIVTRPANYAWFPEGVDTPAAMNGPLIQIFFLNVIFWLVIANALVYGAKMLYFGVMARAVIVIGACIAFYYGAGYLVENATAQPYYTIFQNQRVDEDYMELPIQRAGYQIGPILLDKVLHAEMPRRKFAVSGLGKVGYQPAIPELKKILLDKSQNEDLRERAYMGLYDMGVEESDEILSRFHNQAKDSADLRILKNIDDWKKYQ